MSHLTFSTFGTLRVALDGVPITSFATDKVRALLVYLAVEATRPHRRETLAHLLWPDLPDRDARHNLSQALWHLRQALGERNSMTPLLLTSRDTVQFNPQRSVSVDVTEFTALLSACDTCTATTSATCAVCLPRLQQAAALYQGDFLAQITLGDDSPFDEWALHWRERLHQQALWLFGTLAELAEQRGDDEEARALLMRQLALEPWREEAHRALMRLLVRRGERSAALAYLLQHPLTRPAIRAQLRECWQTAQATFPTELLAASEAAAQAFATQPPVALLSCFTLTPHPPAVSPPPLAAGHTPAATVPDLPDRAQSSATPAP